MSDRNTGLFVKGHVPPQAVLDTLAGAPDLDVSALQGEEAPRVGHAEHNGHPYTHVGLRLFEEGGVLLLERAALPEGDDLELHLGRALSRDYGIALFLYYDDEQGCGGHARFEGGALVSRTSVDGRPFTPVIREGEAQRELTELDESDWVWPLLGDAIEAGAAPLLGAGVRTDDDIEALLRAAGAEPVDGQPVTARTASPQVRPQDAGESGRLRRLLHRMIGRDRR